MEKIKGIIHDIANKLTISKSVNRKLENLLGKDHKEVKRLKKSLEDSILLLDDLRKSSSDEKKNLPLENIQTLKETEYLKVQSLMSLYDIEIEYRNEIDNDIWINLNSYSSDRILSNCIDNAKHAGAKKIVIEYLLKGNHIQLKIKDNGIGMSQDVLEKVGFGYSSQTGDNHGIGTQVIRNMVQEVGGSVQWHSIEDLGTCCNIKFNIVKDEQQIDMRKETLVKRINLISTPNLIEEKKILVVSHSPTELGIWENFLSNIGAQVATTEYAEVAMNHMYKYKPDCLLFNKSLKDMSAKAWLKIIMSDPSLIGIPKVLYVEEDENLDFLKNIPFDELVNFTQFNEKNIYMKLKTLFQNQELQKLKNTGDQIAREGEHFSVSNSQKKVL
ncbi:hypothetical protein A9Q84_05755 [Halobacteriovorax marinus]|uniref:histidine kinase n=1 Tax=Halobacteriovorax marinus TaxID=97084 RepID=A0A1Y5FBD6_9BACT|nr:hypothetical protein A9Q84_05755 [Halobacteriovorax marinus]